MQVTPGTEGLVPWVRVLVAEEGVEAVAVREIQWLLTQFGMARSSTHTVATVDMVPVDRVVAAQAVVTPDVGEATTGVAVAPTLPVVTVLLAILVQEAILVVQVTRVLQVMLAHRAAHLPL